MENLKGFTYPATAKYEQITIFDQNSHLRLKTQPWGLKIMSSFCLNVILLWMHFDHGKNQNSDFQFLPFFNRLYRGLR